MFTLTPFVTQFEEWLWIDYYERTYKPMIKFA